jgi:hypothetical protein
VLRISFYIKLVFVIVEILLAIAFAACNFTKAKNAAAVIEWLIAFIFSFYVFSFYVDLYPAVRTRKTGAGFKSHDPAVRHAADREMEEAGSDRYLTGQRGQGHENGHANGHANGYTNGSHDARGVHNNF